MIAVDKRSAALQLFASIARSCGPARRREGRYLLRTNLTDDDPAMLWQYYIQLVASRRRSRTSRAISPSGRSSTRTRRRIEAHIFVAFLAYCLHVTLTRRLHALAPGLTARSALEKFAAVQMIDVHLPDHRRPRDRADPLHPTRARTATPDRPAQLTLPASRRPKSPPPLWPKPNSL